MKKYIFFFAFLLFGLTTFSQTDSLTYYLEISIKNNPGILQKMAEFEASLQKIVQVGTLPDPELSTGIFLKPMELVGGNQLADIRLMQMFPWFGVLRYAKDEMSLMAKAKFELLRDAKLQLCLEVQQSWFELFKNKKAIDWTAKNLHILQTLESISLTKFKSASAGSATSSVGSMAASSPPTASNDNSGMGSMGKGAATNASSAPLVSTAGMSAPGGGSGLADLYRIQMEMAELENNLASLKSNRLALMAQFNSFMNRPAQMTLALPDSLHGELTDIPVQMVVDSMLNNHPMVAMLKREQESLEARQRMITRMGYPMVGLGLNYSLINKNPDASNSMNGKDMIMPMVTITLPIYRKKYEAMQRETKSLQSAAVEGIKSTQNSLRDEIYRSFQTYQDAQSGQRRYNRQLQLAEQTLNLLTKSYSTSGTGLTELLRVNQQILDIHLKIAENEAEFQAAVAKLKRLGNLH